MSRVSTCVICIGVQSHYLCLHERKWRRHSNGPPLITSFIHSPHAHFTHNDWTVSEQLFQSREVCFLSADLDLDFPTLNVQIKLAWTFWPGMFWGCGEVLCLIIQLWVNAVDMKPPSSFRAHEEVCLLFSNPSCVTGKHLPLKNILWLHHFLGGEMTNEKCWVALWEM